MHTKEFVACKTDGHAAGTPCTDFSSQGLQQGLSGVTTLYLLTWMSLMNGLEPSVIAQENVAAFPTDVLKQGMGHKFMFEWLVDDSVHYGWPGHRVRKFTGMRHRRLQKSHLDDTHPICPLAAFMRLFHRQCGCTFREFFRASPEDVCASLVTSLDAAKEAVDRIDITDGEQWQMCINDNQKKRLTSCPHVLVSYNQ